MRLTETLTEEVKDFNIQANAIAPGSVKIKLVKQRVASEERTGRRALAKAEKVLEGEDDGFDSTSSLTVFLASDEYNDLTERLLSTVRGD